MGPQQKSNKNDMGQDNTGDPYDQRVARLLVGPLARLGVTPNLMTAITLAMALAAAWLFASGEAGLAHWAAGIFVLARFLDHVDGELARRTGKTSRFGYYFDYVAGSLSYIALFIGIALGLSAGPLGGLALLLGALAAAVALITLPINMSLDRSRGLSDGEAVGYPGLAGFELEDGVYLLAPITWLGWLQPFFLLCCLGAAVYGIWCLWCLARARQDKRDAPAAP